jgi:hypothetical protein
LKPRAIKMEPKTDRRHFLRNSTAVTTGLLAMGGGRMFGQEHPEHEMHNQAHGHGEDEFPL